MQAMILRGLVLFSLVMGVISCAEKGCTDPSALNYSQNAEINDESCLYNPSSLDFSLTSPAVICQLDDVVYSNFNLAGSPSYANVRWGSDYYYDSYYYGTDFEVYASAQRFWTRLDIIYNSNYDIEQDSAQIPTVGRYQISNNSAHNTFSFTANLGGKKVDSTTPIDQSKSYVDILEVDIHYVYDRPIVKLHVKFECVPPINRTRNVLTLKGEAVMNLTSRY